MISQGWTVESLSRYEERIWRRGQSRSTASVCHCKEQPQLVCQSGEVGVGTGDASRGASGGTGLVMRLGEDLGRGLLR